MRKILLKQKYKIILFVLLSLVVGGIDISFALIIQLFISSIENNDLFIFQLSVVLFVFFILSNYFMTYWLIRLQSIIQKKIHIEMKRRLMNFCLYTDFENIQKVSIGEKINYFEYYMDVYEQYYLNNVWEFIANIFILIIGMVYLLSVSTLITILVLGLGMLSLILPIILGKIVNDMVDKNSKLNSEFLSKIKEILTGMEVIRGYRLEKQFSDEFTQKLVTLEEHTQALGITNGKLNQLSALFQYTIIILCLIISGAGVIVGKVNLGQLVAVTQVSNMLIMPMQQIGIAVLEIKGSKSIREKLDNLLEFKYLENYNKKIETLELKNVSLNGDDGRKILDNVTLTFNDRKKYAIIGENGSGKSTLFQVILGIRKNYSGNIFVNGEGLKGRIIADISFLPQESAIFGKNLSENILLGREDLREKLDEILRRVNISECFFNNKRMSEIACESMSGGEKRKINIARTLISNSSLVLMDEFENTLDNETKIMIQDYILEQGKLIICITHSSDEEFLNKMDEIIYLKDGKVVSKSEYEARMSVGVKNNDSSKSGEAI